MNNYKILSLEEYNTRFPNNDSFDISNMTIELSKHYLKLYSYYEYLLLQYLNKILSIKKYDNYFKNSILKYKTIEESASDVYQRLSRQFLSYFYLRNNLYLNRLSSDDRHLLEKKMNAGVTILDPELNNLIAKTFKVVTFEGKKIIDNKKIEFTNFGPETERFFAPISSIVIGFRYDEYCSNGLDDIEWDNNHNKQINEIVNILNKMSEEFQKLIDIPVIIIQYDEMSVKLPNNSADFLIK